MKFYEIGGCVRDSLLGLISSDIDYVVLHACEQELLDLGYQKIGKSFPVYVNPKTKHQYALARIEEKIGYGHCDFKIDANPDISLYQDSLRRDFRCNAIYRDIITNELIDYHSGIEDIKNKVLHHVSDSFKEDPLRVLRMCRFVVQLEFKPHPMTLELCKNMVANGCLKHLSKDRIWQEFIKSLKYPTFYNFFKYLELCNGLPDIAQQLNTHYIENKIIKNSNTSNQLVNFALAFSQLENSDFDKLAKQIGASKQYIKFTCFVIKYQSLIYKDIQSNAQDYIDMVLQFIHYKKLNYFSNFMEFLAIKNINNYDKIKTNIESLLDSVEQIKFSDVPNYQELSPEDLKQKYTQLIINNTSLI